MIGCIFVRLSSYSVFLVLEINLNLCYIIYLISRLLSAEAATAALEPTAQQRTHM